jgi:hypothetical protein
MGAFLCLEHVYLEKCVVRAFSRLFAHYGWSMLQAMCRYLLISLLLVCFSANAEIYKRVDEDGNVHFSDSGADGAEQVELPKANTYTPTVTETAPRAKEIKTAPGYTDIAIVKPEMNATIRSNLGDVSVSIDLKPTLRPGDSITLFMDGKELLKNKRQTSFALSGIDRGSHTLRATVIGANGEELISSKSTLFHLHKRIVKKKKTSSNNSASSSQQSSKRNYNLGTTNSNQGITSNSGTFSSGSGYDPSYNQN